MARCTRKIKKKKINYTHPIVLNIIWSVSEEVINASYCTFDQIQEVLCAIEKATAQRAL